MKKLMVLLFLLLGGVAFAQATVNDYKYVIVPAKFSFLQKEDQYRLNTLTKYLLEKYNFTVYLDSDVLPDELSNSNCGRLYADVQSVGNFMTTKLIINLKDCKNRILFSSTEGKSKEKEYAKAYNEAIRDAFSSFETLHYNYSPITTVVATDEAAPKQLFENDRMLFAQPTTNGFHLVDGTAKVILKILKTSTPSCYIAVFENATGLLISKDNQWFLEYYQGQNLISKKVEIKF